MTFYFSWNVLCLALLRLHRCDLVRQSQATVSMSQQAERAGEGKRRKCFSIIFFLCIPYVWLTAQRCTWTWIMSLEYLLCKIDILFSCDCKHFMSVFLMWAIGGGPPLDSLDNPYRWERFTSFCFTCVYFLDSIIQYRIYHQIVYIMLVSSRLNRSWTKYFCKMGDLLRGLEL